MIRYRKFQFGWFIVSIFLIVLVFLTLSWMKQWGTNPIDTPGYIFLMALFTLVLFFFYGITVTVNDKQVRIKLGIGLYTRKINLDSILSVSLMEYPIWYGYGIRIVPKGILYNVSGKHAVEIRLKGKKGAVLIGTDDPDNLKEAIEKNLSHEQIDQGIT
jgi:hypothetical protein